jgi:hypothetical protein
MASKLVKKASAPTKAQTKRAVIASKSRSPNAVSLRALGNAKSGRVTHYTDESELFRKLGVKVVKR